MSNYPMGAEHDPRAPYNQQDLPTAQVDVVVTMTMACKCTIEVDDYQPEFEEDEHGHTEVRVDSVDYDTLMSCYKNQYLSIPEMMKMLHDFAKERLSDGKFETMNEKWKLESAIRSTEGWEIADEDIED